ncbi:hypothetical protein [Actinomadura sp. HBU206391]|uniref:hypothetical protein n=1 Tax=Actinomadura sp. HBU206391 TaxID=2731692 RepID=UPI0016500B81|nr:hypothetical protein [Actinomadura sp. HBU206391]MBC6456864.1 hypothetical protein [Actinomadura sp. HBU206391]
MQFAIRAQSARNSKYDGEKGEGAASYLGVVCLIAAVTTGVIHTGAGEAVASSVKRAVCGVAGGNCQPAEAQAARPAGNGDPAAPGMSSRRRPGAQGFSAGDAVSLPPVPDDNSSDTYKAQSEDEAAFKARSPIGQLEYDWLRSKGYKVTWKSGEGTTNTYAPESKAGIEAAKKAYKGFDLDPSKGRGRFGKTINLDPKTPAADRYHMYDQWVAEHTGVEVYNPKESPKGMSFKQYVASQTEFAAMAESRRLEFRKGAKNLRSGESDAVKSYFDDGSSSFSLYERAYDKAVNAAVAKSVRLKQGRPNAAQLHKIGAAAGRKRILELWKNTYDADLDKRRWVEENRPELCYVNDCSPNP